MRAKIPALAAALLATATPVFAQTDKTAVADPARPSPYSVLAAPAFKVGSAVVDRRGRPIGIVVGVGEAPDGSMRAVVKIDGRLVSLAENTVTLRGDQVVSVRTKAQLLAGSGAVP